MAKNGQRCQGALLTLSTQALQPGPDCRLHFLKATWLCQELGVKTLHGQYACGCHWTSRFLEFHVDAAFVWDSGCHLFHRAGCFEGYHLPPKDSLLHNQTPNIISQPPASQVQRF